MKIVKGYTKQVNAGPIEFISKEEYERLSREYVYKCDKTFIRSESPDSKTYGYSFYSEHNVIYLGWANYPDFNQ